MLRINFSSVVWPIVILIIALSAFYLKPWETNQQNIISISATGKTDVTPNIAKISATVSTTNDNLDSARKQNEEKVNKLITALNSLGITERDIKTQNLSGGTSYPPYEIQTQPQQDIQIYPPQRKPTNQISTTFEVTIREFTKADEVIRALTQNGATQIYGPQLTMDDETLEKAKSKARQNAVENAKKKAQELSGQLNKKVGDATKITEQGDSGLPVPLVARSEADLEQKASQIQPGQNEVTVSVAVDFELK